MKKNRIRVSLVEPQQAWIGTRSITAATLPSSGRMMMVMMMMMMIMMMMMTTNMTMIMTMTSIVPRMTMTMKPSFFKVKCMKSQRRGNEFVACIT